MRKMKRNDPSDGTSGDGNGYTRGVQGTIDVMVSELCNLHFIRSVIDYWLCAFYLRLGFVAVGLFTNINTGLLPIGS